MPAHDVIRFLLIVMIAGLSLSWQKPKCRLKMELMSTSKTEISAAEAVAVANSFQEVLQAVSLFRLPGLEIQPHEKQLIHLRKRQATSTHALKRICKFLIGVSCKNNRLSAIQTVEFLNLLKCSFFPLSESTYSSEVNGQDVDSYCDAFRAVGSLAPLGCTTELSQSLHHMAPFIVKLASDMSLSGLDIALERLSIRPPSDLRARIDSLKLPFKLLCGLADTVATLEEVKNEVPFRRDIISTVKGRNVVGNKIHDC
jgi:hypothetical protein